LLSVAGRPKGPDRPTERYQHPGDLTMEIATNNRK